MRRLTDLAALAFWLTTLVSNQLVARDDGRFADSPLKPWFDRLASGKGLCCSFADSVAVQDVDWDTRDGHYRVPRWHDSNSLFHAGRWHIVQPFQVDFGHRVVGTLFRKTDKRKSKPLEIHSGSRDGDHKKFL